MFTAVLLTSIIKQCKINYRTETLKTQKKQTGLNRLCYGY